MSLCPTWKWYMSWSSLSPPFHRCGCRARRPQTVPSGRGLAAPAERRKTTRLLEHKVFFHTSNHSPPRTTNTHLTAHQRRQNRSRNIQPQTVLRTLHNTSLWHINSINCTYCWYGYLNGIAIVKANISQWKQELPAAVGDPRPAGRSFSPETAA